MAHERTGGDAPSQYLHPTEDSNFTRTPLHHLCRTHFYQSSASHNNNYRNGTIKISRRVRGVPSRVSNGEVGSKGGGHRFVTCIQRRYSSAEGSPKKPPTSAPTKGNPARLMDSSMGADAARWSHLHSSTGQGGERDRTGRRGQDVTEKKCHQCCRRWVK